MTRTELIMWLAQRLYANGLGSKKNTRVIAEEVIDELIRAGYLNPDPDPED